MDLAPYIKACYPIIYVVTPEEVRAELIIQNTAVEMKRKIRVWSYTDGFKRPGDKNYTSDAKDMEPTVALATLRDEPLDKTSAGEIIVMRDLHMFLGNPKPVRLLRDIVNIFKKAKKTLIIVSPVKKIPPELERDITVVELELPNKDEIKTVFNSLYTDKAKQALGEISEDEQERIIQAAMGLTFGEADNAFAKAFIEYHADKSLPLSKLVLREKAIAVKKSGILEYFEPKQTADDIGGLENLKNWLKMRSKAFSKKAREFGLPMPRGILLVGLPGCGKSLSAKVASNILGLPLLRFDIGKVFGGLVGESIAPNEEILFYTPHGIKRLTIEDAFNRQSELQDVKVSSFTSEMKHEFKKVNKFIRHERKNDLVRVTTTSGRHIDVTAEHSLFTVGSDGKLEEVSANKLVKGTFIAIPMAHIETDLIKEFNILDLIRKNDHEKNWFIKDGYATYSEELRNFVPQKNYHSFKKHHLNVGLANVTYVPPEAELTRHGPAKESFKQNLILTENFMELMGWFVAEGSFSGRHIAHTTNNSDKNAAQPRLSINKDEVDCVSKLIKACGYACEVYADRNSNGRTVFFGGAGLGFVIKYLGFKENLSRIPEWIFGTSAKLKAAFIRGFFSGDGGISGHNIESSQSIPLTIHDVKLLLSTLGIHARSYRIKEHSRFKNANPDARRLSISTAKMIRRYIDLIGFTQPAKNTKASEMKLTENGQWIPVFSALKENCAKYRRQQYKDGGLDFNISGASVNIKIAEKMMPEISKWEIVFERIKSVETHLQQPKYVYDISVEDNHNFVAGFGGILCHNSERNMRTAIATADSINSCVIWLDELEKGFAGMAGGHSGDGGTSQRVFGSFLSWMQEKTSACFIIATVNRIESLPPELLRKGRFDETFFVGLPSDKEREQIIRVHLRLKNQELSAKELQECVKHSKGFSGAELEEAIIGGMYQAFDQDRKLTGNDIISAIKITNPLSKSRATELKAMADWAQNNAINASKVEKTDKPEDSGFASTGRQLEF